MSHMTMSPAATAVIARAMTDRPPLAAPSPHRATEPGLPPLTPPAGVPLSILQAMVRDYLGDPTAVITRCTSQDLPHNGTNDSTHFYRVTLTWATLRPIHGPHTATWIVKHWQAGGDRDGAAGIAQPRELLAWEQGLLRPAALPAGVVVPIVGTQRAPDGSAAWLAMTDVSPDLANYPRLALTADAALASARHILARLAQFHAHWQRPGRQAMLQAQSWRDGAAMSLWEAARTYALALGARPVPHCLPGAGGPPPPPDLSADLAAFLDDRPADERSLWSALLVDRQPLVDALSAEPLTLIHNDLDDRNIGLRLSDNGRPPDLVLIDWEWLTVGPAALDVAKLVQLLPLVIRPGTPLPDDLFNDALADQYLGHYRAAGGQDLEPGAWRRAYRLARVARYLGQLPAVYGRLLRTSRGEAPAPAGAGIPPAIVAQHVSDSLTALHRVSDTVARDARRWLV